MIVILSSRSCGDSSLQAHYCDRPDETPVQIGFQRRSHNRILNNPRCLLSQPRFMNRQSLYLRPDPARVVVRPFKPATEPRDLNATIKSAPTILSAKFFVLIPKLPRIY